jgi:predicted nucleic acid-binding protein
VVIPDANLLIYAYQSQTVQHEAALAWLEAQFAGEDIVGLCWPTLWAFIRINSNPRIWRRFAPSPDELFDRIDGGRSGRMWYLYNRDRVINRFFGSWFAKAVPRGIC